MNFLIAHKHLVLAVIAVVALYAVVAKVQAHFDGVAHDQRVIAEQQVKEDLDKAKLQATQTAMDKMALQDQLKALALSNANLEASLVQLRGQLKDQQSRDAALAPDALAARWSMLADVPTGEIAPAGNGVLASLTAAHSTVALLEEIPVLKQEAAQKDANSAQKDGTILAQQKIIGDQDGELATCKKTITDKDAACNAQVKDEQAKARKAKRNWFIAGAVAVLAAWIGIKH